MKAGSIQWRLHVIELFIVTLGIFMGFGLNNCNETRKEKRQVQLYLEGIKLLHTSCMIRLLKHPARRAN